jgi:hypothetical protein
MHGLMRNFGTATREAAGPILRGCLALGLALAAAACGSVGGGLNTGSGGSPGGTGGAAPTGAGGGSDASTGQGGAAGGAIDAGSDTRADVAITDGGGDAGDAGVLPVSCQAIKQQTPGATSGVYTIAPLSGTSQSVFCEMVSDGGGWTAFYIGDNGQAPGGAHFETAADACPDPANSCLRRLPITVDATRDFAVKCGASVVKFKLGSLALDYLRNGLEHGWQPLTNAVTIDIGIVGKANLVANLWTGGTTANYGWIVSGPGADTSAAVLANTFANGYTTNTSWNFCNGVADASSRVMLFYR